MDIGRSSDCVADAEHELTWEGILSDMNYWGLAKVDLIISDGHTGIQTAAGNMFQGSSSQMCHVPFIQVVSQILLQKISQGNCRDLEGMSE